MTDFFETVRKYLIEYLPKQKCFTENTIRSYRQTLNLFVVYIRDVKQFPLTRIDFSIIDRNMILDFLGWLETERNCCANTRNQRLMALRSFLDYAGKEDCAQIALYVTARNVPIKETQRKIVDFLSEEELSVLLRQPDCSKPKGIRDMMLMVLMYDTAARCSEILEITLEDLRLDVQHPTVLLHGKGRKLRTVPLMPRTVQHCKRYLHMFHPEQNGTDYLFYTVIHGERKQMSRDNAEKIIGKYGKRAKQSHPDLHEHIFPHMLRHTRAMHLYRSGMPLDLLSQFLGHASEETTRIYAYADTEMKRAAMEKADASRKNGAPPVKSWVNDEDTILMLSGLK